jgi:hypothetical protein
MGRNRANLQHCNMGSSPFCDTAIWGTPHSAALQYGGLPILQHSNRGTFPKLYASKMGKTSYIATL